MKTYYYNLDGLRGVAAFSVLLYHIQYFGHGYLSVDLFFILSGFVLALKYEQRLRSGMAWYAFLLRRIKRLMPTFWLGVLVCIFCALYLYNQPSLVSNYALKTLFFIPSINSAIGLYPMDPPAWSLEIEWLLCIVFAGGLYRSSTGTHAVITSSCWAAILCLSLLYFNKWDGNFVIRELPVGNFIRGLPAFCLGIIICRFRTSAALKRLPVISPNLLLIFWIGLTLVPYSSALYDIGTVILVAPLLVILLIRSDAKSPQWCTLAGRMSYPLYVSHFAIVQSVRHYFTQTNVQCYLLTLTGACITACVIMKLNDIIQRHLPDISLRLPQALRGH